jgi:3-dehydroquinate synthetase
MRAEIRHGISVGRTSPRVAAELEAVLRSLGLPLSTPQKLDRDAMLRAASHDKKRVRATIRVPVVHDVGFASCIAVGPDEVAEMVTHLDSTVPPGKLIRTVEVLEKP